jgi:monoamine oxidase
MGQMASSFRISGGMAALVAALAADLPRDRVQLSMQVTGAALRDDGVTLTARDSKGDAVSISATQAIFALPPRLLESTLAFTPPTAQAVRDHWQATPTWMAPHAKFLAVYDRPFWREKGLSGTAQSMVGPLVEIHDASAMSGGAALFGFIGVPALARQSMGEDALKALCVWHLSKLFGPEAAHPVSIHLKDWSADTLTATVDDWDAAAGHPSAAHLPWMDSVWSRHAALAGSETGDTHPGYLEGALEAAAKAVETLHKAGAAMAGM